MKVKLIALILLAAAAAMAQQSNGYVFFGPGAASGHGGSTLTLHMGGGVDAMIAKGIGVNAEIGAMWPPKACFADCVVGIFSPGGTYYFTRGRESKVEPFVNGGYSLMFRSGHGNLFYFGGGLNYWMSKKVGLRMEFRDHVPTYDSSAHFWGFRLGLSFR